MTKHLVLLFLLLAGFSLSAQENEQKVSEAAEKKMWYDKFKIGGYFQVRYNDLYKTNPYLEHIQGDKTYGGYHGISIRRMRLKVRGQLHPRLYFYFQTDFASDGRNIGQLRDAYMDLFLTETGSWRFRAGQSKIQFGFENLQSSQNRITLDRAEAVNSALKDERDYNFSVLWAPPHIIDRFNHLVKSGLKGSGYYGAFSFTMFNGQKANELVPDLGGTYDKPFHKAVRFSWPFELKSGQFVEASIQAYTGTYLTKVVRDGVYVKGITDADGNPVSGLEHGWDDQRIAASFVYYPQPFGIHGEIVTGRGPEYIPGSATDGNNGYMDTQSLFGGYIQACYLIKIKKQILIPFTKWQYYDGGKKFEQDARSYTSREVETGLEWQPFKQFEMAAMYTWADRRFEDSKNPDNRQVGSLIRVQLQVNY